MTEEEIIELYNRSGAGKPLPTIKRDCIYYVINEVVKTFIGKSEGGKDLFNIDVMIWQKKSLTDKYKHDRCTEKRKAYEFQDFSPVCPM